MSFLMRAALVVAAVYALSPLRPGAGEEAALVAQAAGAAKAKAAEHAVAAAGLPKGSEQVIGALDAEALARLAAAASRSLR